VVSRKPCQCERQDVAKEKLRKGKSGQKTAPSERFMAEVVSRPVGGSALCDRGRTAPERGNEARVEKEPTRRSHRMSQNVTGKNGWGRNRLPNRLPRKAILKKKKEKAQSGSRKVIIQYRSPREEEGLSKK